MDKKGLNIQKLKNFIAGSLLMEMTEYDWGKNLDREIPNWKQFLSNIETWKSIENEIFKSNLTNLLKLMLKYAPVEIIADYVNNKKGNEKNVISEVILSDGAHLLNSELWNLINKEEKIWIIDKVLELIIKDISNIVLETNFGHLYGPKCTIVPSFNHPLWFKLKKTIEICEDFYSYRIVVEIESRKRSNANIQKDISKKVMIDPSILLTKKGLNRIINIVIDNKEKFQFFISKKFYEYIKRNKNNWESDNIPRFFTEDNNIELNSPNEILDKLKEIDGLIKPCCSKNYEFYDKYKKLYKNLEELEEDEVIRDIIFEEWIFIQEYSWLITDSKKMIKKFKEIGATSLEIGNDTLKNIIHKTQFEYNFIINEVELIKKFSKFVVSGCGFVDFILNLGIRELTALCVGYGLFVTIYSRRL